MSRRVRPVRFLLATATVVAAALAAPAVRAAPGDLNPPPGPVGPTMKPLDVVEPAIPLDQEHTPGDSGTVFHIGSPGSYYLTGNLSVPAGKMGIRITASNVQVDLRGFQVAGQGSSTTGIGLGASVGRLVIRDGTLVNFSLYGVDLTTSGLGAEGAVLERLVVSGCGAGGVRTGHFAVVRACVVRTNSGDGFVVGIGSSVSECTASVNGGHGLVADLGCVVSRCSSFQNGGAGFDLLSSGSLIADCRADLNAGDGIRAAAGAVIRGNSCSQNGNGGSGAGIHVTGTDNRLEGNSCVGADRGIDVDAAGNVILRNGASGNTTNWDVSAGNVCLVVQAAATAGAILGNSGGTAPGSTDPSANFTF